MSPSNVILHRFQRAGVTIPGTDSQFSYFSNRSQCKSRHLILTIVVVRTCVYSRSRSRYSNASGCEQREPSARDGSSSETERCCRLPSTTTTRGWATADRAVGKGRLLSDIRVVRTIRSQRSVDTEGMFRLRITGFLPENPRNGGIRVSLAPPRESRASNEVEFHGRLPSVFSAPTAFGESPDKDGAE